jgi:hypothetical protein
MRTSIEDAECESIALEVRRWSRGLTPRGCVFHVLDTDLVQPGKKEKNSCTVLTLASFYPSAEVGYTAVPSRTFNRGAGRGAVLRGAGTGYCGTRRGYQRGWFNVETLLRQLVLTLKLRKC